MDEKQAIMQAIVLCAVHEMVKYWHSPFEIEFEIYLKHNNNKGKNVCL